MDTSKSYVGVCEKSVFAASILPISKAELTHTTVSLRSSANIYPNQVNSHIVKRVCLGKLLAKADD